MSQLRSRHIMYFETRIELRSDFSLIETFQDGSQLIHKKGLMIIVESSKASLSDKMLKPSLTMFSEN